MYWECLLQKKKRTGNVLYYTLGQEWEDKSESAT